MDSPNRTENMSGGRNTTTGAVPLIPRTGEPHPQMEYRVHHSEGGAGRQQVHHRGHRRDHQAVEHEHQQQERQDHDHRDEQGQLAGEVAGEVDLHGGCAPDQDVQAAAGLGRRHDLAAELAEQLGGLGGLRGGARVEQRDRGGSGRAHLRPGGGHDPWLAGCGFGDPCEGGLARRPVER
jgi:hypothetical protein